MLAASQKEKEKKEEITMRLNKSCNLLYLEFMERMRFFFRSVLLICCCVIKHSTF